MGVQVTRNRHGYLALRIFWRGRDEWVGSKLRDDGKVGRNRRRLEARAMLIAENLRKAIEGLGIEHSTSIVSDHITLSIGGAAALAADLSPERLIASADAGLYRAKREGRNKAVVVRHEAAALPLVAASG